MFVRNNNKERKTFQREKTDLYNIIILRLIIINASLHINKT